MRWFSSSPPVEQSTRSADDRSQPASTAGDAGEPGSPRGQGNRTEVTLQEAHAIMTSKNYDVLPADDPRQIALWRAQGLKGSRGYLSPSRRRLLLSDGVTLSLRYSDAAPFRGTTRESTPKLQRAHALISGKGFELLPVDDPKQSSFWEAQGVPGSPECRRAWDRRLLLSDGERPSPSLANAAAEASRGLRSRTASKMTLETTHAALSAAGLRLLPATDTRQQAFWESQVETQPRANCRRLLLINGKASPRYASVQAAGAGSEPRVYPTLAEVHAEIAQASPVIKLLPADDPRQVAHWDSQCLLPLKDTTLLLVNGKVSPTYRVAYRMAASPAAGPKITGENSGARKPVPCVFCLCPAARGGI